MYRIYYLLIITICCGPLIAANPQYPFGNQANIESAFGPRTTSETNSSWCHPGIDISNGSSNPCLAPFYGRVINYGTNWVQVRQYETEAGVPNYCRYFHITPYSGIQNNAVIERSTTLGTTRYENNNYHCHLEAGNDVLTGSSSESAYNTFNPLQWWAHSTNSITISNLGPISNYPTENVNGTSYRYVYFTIRAPSTNYVVNHIQIALSDSYFNHKTPDFCMNDFGGVWNFNNALNINRQSSTNDYITVLDPQTNQNVSPALILFPKNNFSIISMNSPRTEQPKTKPILFTML